MKAWLPLALALSVRVAAQTSPQARGIVHRQVAGDGELERAWYERGSSTIQVSLTKRQTPEGRETELLFTEGGRPLLEWTVDQLRGRQFRLTVRSRGVVYSKFDDLRGVSTTLGDRRVTVTGRAKVRVNYNSRVWNGEFDFPAMRSAGVESAPGFARVLPEDVLTKIGPLLSEAKSVETAYYETKATRKGLQLVEPMMALGGEAFGPKPAMPWGSAGGGGCSEAYYTCLGDAWAEYLICVREAKQDKDFFAEAEVLGCMAAYAADVAWCTDLYCAPGPEDVGAVDAAKHWYALAPRCSGDGAAAVME